MPQLHIQNPSQRQHKSVARFVGTCGPRPRNMSTVTPNEMHHQEVRHQTQRLWLKTYPGIASCHGCKIHVYVLHVVMFTSMCVWPVFIWYDSWTRSHHTPLYTCMHIRMPQHLDAMVQSLGQACSSATVISTLMFGNETTNKITDGTSVRTWLSTYQTWASWAQVGAGRWVSCLRWWTPWHHIAVSQCSEESVAHRWGQPRDYVYNPHCGQALYNCDSTCTQPWNHSTSHGCYCAYTCIAWPFLKYIVLCNHPTF